MLTGRTKLLAAGAAVAAGAAINNAGNAIDTDGFDTVRFIVPIEDSVATGVATVEVHGSDASGSGFARLDVEAVSATCVTNDDINQKFLCVEVHKPIHRYVKCVRKSATANIAYGTAIAELSAADVQPPAAGDSLAQIKAVSPALA